MPRPSTSTAKATAELRRWKRTGNRFEGYIYNDATGIFPDNTWKKFDASDYIRVLDKEWHPFLMLQTYGWVFQLDRSEECK